MNEFRKIVNEFTRVHKKFALARVISDETRANALHAEAKGEYEALCSYYGLDKEDTSHVSPSHDSRVQAARLAEHTVSSILVWSSNLPGFNNVIEMWEDELFGSTEAPGESSSEV